MCIYGTLIPKHGSSAPPPPGFSVLSCAKAIIIASHTHEGCQLVSWIILENIWNLYLPVTRFENIRGNCCSLWFLIILDFTLSAYVWTVSISIGVNVYFGTNDATRQNHILLHMHFDVIIPSVSILNIWLAGLTAPWTLKTKNGMLSCYYTKRC